MIGEAVLNARDEVAAPLHLDGTPGTATVNGREMACRLQDIEALPDLYLTRLDVFEALFPGNPVLTPHALQRFREEVPRGEMFSSSQALLAMGADIAQAVEMASMITHSARDGWVFVGRLPERLRSRSTPQIRSRDVSVVLAVEATSAYFSSKR